MLCRPSRPEPRDNQSQGRVVDIIVKVAIAALVDDAHPFADGVERQFGHVGVGAHQFGTYLSRFFGGDEERERGDRESVRDEHAVVCGVDDRRANLRGRPVGVLMDLAGPKMRLGELPGGQL